MQYFESFPKDMFGEFPSIAVGKEVAINFLKFFDRQLTIGTVFEESFVPLLYLCLTELCVAPQIIQHFRLQFTVLFSHFLC